MICDTDAMDDGAKPPELSFVLPACNEEANVAPMIEELVETATSLGHSFEILFVNDGSTDRTAELLDEQASRDSRVRVLHLSRNFGHMAALTAGLEHARGSRAVITMDADGQHPPSLIPELIAEWRHGAKIVQALRIATAHASPLKRLTSKAFYRLFSVLSPVTLPPGASDFRLLDREVVDNLNAIPERERFVRGLISWMGYDPVFLRYAAPPRMAGRSNYSPMRMVAFALTGVTSFSFVPLRLATLLGGLLSLAGMGYALYVLWCYVRGVPLVPGWTSTLLVVLFLGSWQLISIGLLGEYLARVYSEVKHRPIYLLKKPPGPPHEKR
ncbi:MAG: glycosyltransferase family 2 protein [bacterium]|nr:glycosyltransferase family 2 protein [bacterium]